MSEERYKPKDRELSQQGNFDVAERQAQISRVVAMVLMDRSVDLKIEAIAKETGLSVPRVRDLMSSEDFESYIAPVLRRKCGALLGRGVEVMSGIVECDAAKPSDRISAFKALTSMYGAVAKSEEAHLAKSDREQLLNVLDRLRKPKNPIKVTDGSSG